MKGCKVSSGDATVETTTTEPRRDQLPSSENGELQTRPLF